MSLDPGDDHEARQLKLVREQRPIVAALRSVGYEIDFLFAPPARDIPAEAQAILEQFLEMPLSLETRLMITDLLESASSFNRAGYGARSRSNERDQ